VVSVQTSDDSSRKGRERPTARGVSLGRFSRPHKQYRIRVPRGWQYAELRNSVSDAPRSIDTHSPCSALAYGNLKTLPPRQFCDATTVLRVALQADPSRTPIRHSRVTGRGHRRLPTLRAGRSSSSHRPPCVISTRPRVVNSSHSTIPATYLIVAID
jgi:hypothetical protein